MIYFDWCTNRGISLCCIIASHTIIAKNAAIPHVAINVSKPVCMPADNVEICTVEGVSVSSVFDVICEPADERSDVDDSEAGEEVMASVVGCTNAGDFFSCAQYVAEICARHAIVR